MSVKPIELCGPMELGAPIDIPLMLDPGGPMLADPKLDEPRLIGRSEPVLNTATVVHEANCAYFVQRTTISSSLVVLLTK